MFGVQGEDKSIGKLVKLFSMLNFISHHLGLGDNRAGTEVLEV